MPLLPLLPPLPRPGPIHRVRLPFPLHPWWASQSPLLRPTSKLLLLHLSRKTMPRTKFERKFGRTDSRSASRSRSGALRARHRRHSRRVGSEEVAGREKMAYSATLLQRWLYLAAGLRLLSGASRPRTWQACDAITCRFEPNPMSSPRWTSIVWKERGTSSRTGTGADLSTDPDETRSVHRSVQSRQVPHQPVPSGDEPRWEMRRHRKSPTTRSNGTC